MAAGYLSEQLMAITQTNQSAAQALKAEELSYAIWQVFDPTDLTSSTLASYFGGGQTGITDANDVENDLSTAGTAVTTNSLYDSIGDYNNIYVYTPYSSDPDGGVNASQEYIYCSGPLTAAPEPGTALFGLALIGIVTTARRRTGNRLA